MPLAALYKARIIFAFLLPHPVCFRVRSPRSAIRRQGGSSIYRPTWATSFTTFWPIPEASEIAFWSISDCRNTLMIRTADSALDTFEDSSLPAINSADAVAGVPPDA
jgi:hypothetical protein